MNKIETTEVEPRADDSLSDSPLSQRVAPPEKKAFDPEWSEIKTNIDAYLAKSVSVLLSMQPIIDSSTSPSILFAARLRLLYQLLLEKPWRR